MRKDLKQAILKHKGWWNLPMGDFPEEIDEVDEQLLGGNRRWFVDKLTVLLIGGQLYGVKWGESKSEAGEHEFYDVYPVRAETVQCTRYVRDDK